MIKIENNIIKLSINFERREQAKTIPGARWNALHKEWQIPYTFTAMEKIAERFADLDWDGKEYWAERIARPLGTGFPEMNTQPWQHQITAFNLGMKYDQYMLGMDMGTGKTLTACALIKGHASKKTLVLCPKAVIPAWCDEVNKHIPEYRTSTRREPLKDIHIINYGLFIKDVEKLRKIEWDHMIVDESHNIKAPGGVTSRAAHSIGRAIPYRYCLTGTPIPHSPMDIYAQYRFMDSAIFGTSFTQFRSRYALMGGFAGKQILQFVNLDELYNKFHSRAYVVKSEDVQDLPESTHVYHMVELPAAARRTYKEMETEFITQVKSGEISSAQNALVKLLRLQQITSGHLKTETGNIEEVHQEKQKELSEIFESINKDERIVVFARFSYDLRQVERAAIAAGRDYKELSGQCDQRAEWQNVLGVQIQAGKEGVSFVEARYQIYYSMGMSLGAYKQSLKRIHRPGQKRHVHYIHILAEQTIDKKVYDRFAKSEEIINALLENPDEIK